jgi:hypothetical protein
MKIDTLYQEKRIGRIPELELQRYVNFFSESSKDNLDHSAAVIASFPRWSIISGYYAMHDRTKLFFAKRYRLKMERKVHETAILTLRALMKDKALSIILNKGYREFLSLANDLEEAKAERVKAQYYTGTEYLRELYRRRSQEFHNTIVLPYLERIDEAIG